jgi:methionyl-tRNA synthetase
VDPVDSSAEKLIFNRTVTLRDSWTKIEKAQRRESKSLNAAKEPQKGAKQDAPTGHTDKRDDLKPIAQEITIEDFSKVDLRTGVIREASLVEGARKLIRLMVDLGEGRLRQIFAGIRAAYPEPKKLVGKKIIVVANLKPRKMKFGVSEGMVLSGGDDDRVCVTTFDGEPLPGDTVS